MYATRERDERGAAAPEPLRRRMSPAELRDRPRRLGWSYRYVDGEMIAASALVVVPYVLRLPPPPGAAAPGGTAVPRATTLRLLRDDDDPALVEVFAAAFDGAMEYLGKTVDEIRASAWECFERRPCRRRGPRHPVSYVAEGDGGVHGAALFRRGREAPLLDLVFVDPRSQRRGVADALVSRAVAHFAELGERKIFSSAMLGNDASVAWHRSFGFEEIPHYLVTAHHAEHHRYECERHRRLGDLPSAELAALEATARYWEDEHRRLQEAAHEEPRAAFPDIY